MHVFNFNLHKWGVINCLKTNINFNGFYWGFQSLLNLAKYVGDKNRCLPYWICHRKFSKFDHWFVTSDLKNPYSLNFVKTRSVFDVRHSCKVRKKEKRSLLTVHFNWTVACTYIYAVGSKTISFMSIFGYLQDFWG